MQRRIMEGLTRKFFRTVDRKRHRPGVVEDFDPEEVPRLLKRRYITLIETATVEQPETRAARGRPRGRKRNENTR